METEKKNPNGEKTSLEEALRLLDIGKDEIFKIYVPDKECKWLKNQLCSVSQFPPYFDITNVVVDKIKQKFSLEDGDFLYFVFICPFCEVLERYEAELAEKNQKLVDEYKRQIEKRAVWRKKRRERSVPGK